MIRQLKITKKTETATLAYSEMGDVIAEPTAGIELTLPEPHPGLWFRIMNITTYTVTIKDSNTTLTTVGEHKIALFLADGSAWAWGK